MRSKFDSDDEEEPSGEEDKAPPTLSRLFTGYQDTGSDEEKQHAGTAEQEGTGDRRMEEEQSPASQSGE